MRLFAGIDIGGTNIKYGIINENGDILESSERPTEAYKGGISIIDKVKEIIHGFKESYNIDGICVSTAGMVCPKEGKILYAGSTIPNYIGVEIKKILEEEFEIPCTVENDVNSAALGELWLGAGKGKKSMVCITVGTGIGGAVVLDGKVVHGFTNSAGEIGYMIVDGEEIQKVASTTALVNSVAKKKGIDSSNLNGKEIVKGYENGDAICIEEIEKIADIIAHGISNVVYLFNPEVVVLGGGIMAREDILRPLIENSLKKYLIESVYKNTNIQFAKLKNTAGMVGAVYNFKNYV